MTPLMAEFRRACDEIEGAYEVMLGYAGQGLVQASDSAAGAQVREHLRRFASALDALPELASRAIAGTDAASGPQSEEFLTVLRRDAQRAATLIRMTTAQDVIGSQLVDNLNASIHVRTILTDLFLLDEILKAHDRASRPDAPAS